MRRVLLLLLTLASTRGEGDAGAAGAADEEDDAPFMLLLESDTGPEAGGAAALVSRRTAVTCAECARGAGAGLRVRAGAGGPARRVARVSEPLDGAAGLAVLELEAKFPAGNDSGVRPIIMATLEGECGAVGAECHLVRARPRLLIVDAELGRPGAGPCAALPHAELCLAGPVLCAGDRGTGVVCGGKLCGVLAWSTGGDGGEGGAQCGDTHAAYSLARRRKFVQCAHTLRQCGRGDCADVCTERLLLTSWSASPPPQPSRLADPPLEEPQRAAVEGEGEAPSRAPHPAWPAPHRSPPAPPAPSPTPGPPSGGGGGGGGLQWVARDYVEYGTDERQYLPLTDAPPLTPLPPAPTSPEPVQEPPTHSTQGGTLALTERTDEEERTLASAALAAAVVPARTKPSRKSGTAATAATGGPLETVIDYELARETAGGAAATRAGGEDTEESSSRAPRPLRPPAPLLLAALALL